MVEVQAGSASSVARVVAMFREAMPAGRDATLGELRDAFEAVLAQLPLREDVTVTAASYGGVEGYWVQAHCATDDRIGVMLHGGGFVMGSATGYTAFAAEISNATGARVFVPAYRLAPEHPFPEGMLDAVRVMQAAVAEVGPRACFAIGDSAGGGLVVTSLMEMHRIGVHLPACIVLVSALVDLTVSNSSFQNRADLDPICGQRGTRRNAALYLAGREPDKVPGAFPMRADLSWLPPSLLLVGSAEVLRDDSRNLADKLEREGADVTYHEYEGMIHVWPLFSSFVPEAQQALAEIGVFVSDRLTQPSPPGHPSM
jgi:epsilon-lactone hydrolase